ncbi:serine/threonine-protein kinase BSK1-like [Malus sylvestris]|uniref:serine/threonine-protein kinase BSK1-like n=1 Tax=Malus sylvestris TaxID=3752 RepID=UPI0021AC55A9|nr:serine/threonine-protein kinase BSK1-like [Malus sylvestris]
MEVRLADIHLSQTLRKAGALCTGLCNMFFFSRTYFFMIGYCCNDDKRLLVTEYMHHDTLAKHLFNWENQTIECAMRLRVALNIAKVLDYCSSEGSPLYCDLNSYMVLFNEVMSPISFPKFVYLE